MNFQDIENTFFHATKKPITIRWVKHKLFDGRPASWCDGQEIFIRIKSHLPHELAHEFENVLGTEKAESFLGFDYEDECIKTFGEFSGYHEEDWAELAEPFVETWIIRTQNIAEYPSDSAKEV